jgi:hypothetical protein
MSNRRALFRITIAAIAVIALVALYGYLTGARWTGIIEYTYDSRWRVTSSDGYKTFWDWLGLLIVPLMLTLGGSLLAVYVTRTLEAQRTRTEWSIKVAEQYLARYSQHAQVTGCLQDSEANLTNNQKNAVKEFANWLELVATLYSHDLVDRQLIREMGFDKLISEFLEQAGRYQYLRDARSGWTNMTGAKFTS